jgi:putative RecB family exonuclease
MAVMTNASGPEPAFPVPTSLSPSRVEAFTTCPMAFRFSSIERLPEPPSPHTTKGSLVHRALELLFTRPAPERSTAAAHAALDTAWAEYLHDPELLLLDLDEAALDEFLADARRLVDAYLAMEDPATVRDIGLELRLEAEIDGLTLRGIIDRLELDPAGELVVTDYKTGRAPNRAFEQQRLIGVNTYSLLVNEVLGRLPARVRLMYLRSGEVIESTPSKRSVQYASVRTTAVWKAVEQACTTGEFRPRPGSLCSGCSFQRWCPAFDGDPARAASEAPLVLAGALA